MRDGEPAGAVPVPYWRLSAFYLFFFATLGALLPYWSVYLRALGYDAGEIGSLMAVSTARWVAPRPSARRPRPGCGVCRRDEDRAPGRGSPPCVGSRA